ncbi:MAG: hypothetical protein ACYCWW_04160 [Deltaproteobacteria bacterium]
MTTTFKRACAMLFVGAAAGFALSTLGCPGKPAGGGDAGTDGGGGPSCATSGETACNSAGDCPNQSNYKCTSNCCVFFCNPANGPADCVANGEPCKSSPLGCVCDEGVCKSKVCSADSECAGQSGAVCKGGSCVAADPVASVASCVVQPNPAVLHAGQSQQFTVATFDSNGSALVLAPGSAQWSITGAGATGSSFSSSTNGLLTVGTTPSTAFGDTSIGVTFSGVSVTCSAIATVYAPPAVGSQVTLLDAESMLPVTDAQVQFSDASGNLLLTAVTGDSLGRYVWTTTPPTAALLNVFDQSYQYVSVSAPASGGLPADMVLLLSQNPVIDPATKSPVVGGYTGDFRSEPGILDPGHGEPASETGDIHFGLAGTAIPQDLLDISLSTLLGPTHDVTINIGGSNVVPLPQGIELGLSDTNYFKCSYDGLGAPGGCGLPACSGSSTTGCLNSETSPSASDFGQSRFACGKRSAWGLGGGIPFSAVAAQIGGSGTSGVNIGALLGSLLPLFNSFNSGVVYEVPYTLAPPIPANQVKDACSGNDFTDATPLPNPAALNSSVTLSLDTPLALAASVTLPALPKLGGTCQQTALVLAGAVESGIGLLPLGISAGTNTQSGATSSTCQTYDSDTPSGGTPNADGHVSLHLAPEHGGVERSSYGVVALAVDVGGLVGKSKGKFGLSGLVQTFPQGMPYGTSVPFSGATGGFLGYAEAASYLWSGRALTNPSGGVTNSSWMRLRFQDAAQAEWVVYFDPSTSGAVLPVPPSSFKDRTYASDASGGKAASTEIQAVEATSGTTYSSFLDFTNGPLAADLVDHMAAFSSVALTPTCSAGDAGDPSSVCGGSADGG